MFPSSMNKTTKQKPTTQQIKQLIKMKISGQQFNHASFYNITNVLFMYT